MRIKIEFRGLQFARQKKLWFLAVVFALFLLPPLPFVYWGASSTTTIGMIVWYFALLLLTYLPVIRFENADKSASEKES